MKVMTQAARLDDLQGLLAVISGFQEQNNLEMSKEHLEGALRLFPAERDLLCLADQVYRACNQMDAALQAANSLIEHHPSYFDGYCRAAQILIHLSRQKEALEILSIGQERLANDKWILFTRMLTYISLQDQQRAIEVGRSLYKLDPEFIDFYSSYITCLYLSDLDHEAEDVIESVFTAFPAEIRAIRLKLDHLFRKRRYAEYRILLYSLTKRLPQFLEEFLDRITRFEFLNNIPISHPRERLHCDICCVASDEGPYIAEFIHHYLYLGFANIIVGINNSTDQTESILKQIQAKHQNVHIVDVNHSQSLFQQYGSYRELFDYGRRNSKSRYCLFVDVDEFWIADPFPKTISDFLSEHQVFDVYSFHWIVCTGEGYFTPPLSEADAYAWNDHLKSICCYESEFYHLRLHAPILAQSDKMTILKGLEENRDFTPVPTGIAIHEASKDYNSSAIGASGLAWVFHRAYRSELEYAYRLFKPHANSSNRDYFKNNRTGYPRYERQAHVHRYIQDILPAAAIAGYHTSLNQFIDGISLEVLLSESRFDVSEEEIQSRLKAIPAEILARDSMLIRSIFRGTRFSQWVDEHVTKL